jgi:hypothetical protein
MIYFYFPLKKVRPKDSTYSMSFLILSLRAADLSLTTPSGRDLDPPLTLTLNIPKTSFIKLIFLNIRLCPNTELFATIGMLWIVYISAKIPCPNLTRAVVIRRYLLSLAAAPG